MKSLVDEYSKEELEEIVASSFSYKEVLKKLGYTTLNGRNSETVKKRLIRMGISTEHFSHKSQTKRSEENVFCKNSTATQATLRRWYLKKRPPDRCDICGQNTQWNGENLTLILDHIDGDNHNNLLENLRYICPNCDSQLPTYAGRNNKRLIKNTNNKAS